MKRPPANPIKEQATPKVEDAPNLGNLPRNLAFLRNVANPHFPHKNAGMHKPMWVHGELADRLLKTYGKQGYVIPHPDIDLSDLSK